LILDFTPSGKYLGKVMIRSVQLLPGAHPGTHSETASGRVSATLDDLAGSRIRRTALIEKIDGAPALRRRLLEIGFTEGCTVRFVMATPFGDPLVFSLRGASIALRKSEARCVRVRYPDA
jgi:ferrous iron transport protein A